MVHNLPNFPLNVLLGGRDRATGGMACEKGDNEESGPERDAGLRGDRSVAGIIIRVRRTRRLPPSSSATQLVGGKDAGIISRRPLAGRRLEDRDGEWCEGIIALNEMLLQTLNRPR